MTPDCDLCGDTGYITVLEPVRYGEYREALMDCPNGCVAPDEVPF